MRSSKDEGLRIVLVSLSVIFLILSLFIVWVYLKPLISAFILAFILTPLYRYFNKLFNSKKVAAAMLCILLVVATLALSVFLINSLTKQAASAYFVLTKTLSSLEVKNSHLFTTLDKFGFNMDLNQLISNIFTNFIKFSQNFVGNLTKRIVDFFVMIFSLFFFLIDRDGLKESFMRLLPIPSNVTKKLVSQISKITSALLFGHFMTGIIQGLIAGIGYVLLGVSSPLLWTVLSIFFAWIPLVGPPIIYVPISLGLFVSGMGDGTWYKGVILLLYGMFIISTIDNFIKPKLIGDRANIHPLVVFVGILGGLSIFGFIGLIIGPIILELFFFSVGLYVDFLKEKEILAEINKEKDKSLNIKNSGNSGNVKIMKFIKKNILKSR